MKKILVLFLILLLVGTTSLVVLSQFREATAKADLHGVHKIF